MKNKKPYGVKLGKKNYRAWATAELDGEKRVIRQGFLTAGEAYNWVSYWKSEGDTVLGVTLKKCFDLHHAASRSGFERGDTDIRISKKLMAFFGEFTDPNTINQVDVQRYVDEHVGCSGPEELRLLLRAIKKARVAQRFTIPKSTNPPVRDGHFMYSEQEFAELWDWSDDFTKSAICLCLLVGLRPVESRRLLRKHVSKCGQIINIPAEIRKNQKSNSIPVCSTVQQYVIDTGVLDIPFRRQGYERITNRAKKERGQTGSCPFRGLRAVRRLLVSWAEEEGFTLDQIALVTGHTRGSVTARYSDAKGMIKIKRKIIEAVERRMHEAISAHGTSSP